MYQQLIISYQDVLDVPATDMSAPESDRASYSSLAVQRRHIHNDCGCWLKALTRHSRGIDFREGFIRFRWLLCLKCPGWVGRWPWSALPPSTHFRKVTGLLTKVALWLGCQQSLDGLVDWTTGLKFNHKYFLVCTSLGRPLNCWCETCIYYLFWHNS